MSDQPKRGGKREGAGRKPDGDSPKVPCPIRLPADVAAYLQSTGNTSKSVAEIVQRSAAFKLWKKSQS